VTKLKLGPLEDDKPKKGTVEFAAHVYRDLESYAEVLAQQTGKPVPDPMKLVPFMVERFMATDRAFASARRAAKGRQSS
jgi:hypothetical protein